MINREISAFFNEEKEWNLSEDRGGYNCTKYTISARVSPFRQLVWNQVRGLVNERLVHHFDTEGNARLKAQVDEWLNLKEVKQDELLTAQGMMLAMAAEMFASAFAAHGDKVKFGLANSLRERGMPDIGYAIVNANIRI